MPSFPLSPGRDGKLLQHQLRQRSPRTRLRLTIWQNGFMDFLFEYQVAYRPSQCVALSYPEPWVCCGLFSTCISIGCGAIEPGCDPTAPFYRSQRGLSPELI